MKKSCAVAGCRPTRFKFKYNEDYSLCKRVKNVMLNQFKRLYDEENVRRFYVGGTLGVDMWAGEILLRLKETLGYEDIELVVVIPFLGHDEKWDERSKKRLSFLIQHSTEHLVIGKQDCKESYIKRNCYMIDHADYLVAVCDKDYSLQYKEIQMVKYAKEKKIPIVYIHPDTTKVESNGFMSN